MDEPEIELTLIPAEDDPDIRSLQSAIKEFENTVSGVLIWSKTRQEASGKPKRIGRVGPTLTGEFALKAAATIGPLLGATLGAWFHGRNGRKVRLRVGDIEAEAQSREDVEKLQPVLRKYISAINHRR